MPARSRGKENKSLDPATKSAVVIYAVTILKSRTPEWRGVFAGGPDQTLFAPRFSKAMNVAYGNLPNLHRQMFLLSWLSRSKSNTPGCASAGSGGN